MRLSIVIVAAILAVGVVPAYGQYVETWNHPGLQNNGWIWDSTSQGVWAPMVWSPTGGVGNSGHVSSDVADLQVGFFIGTESYVAWLDAGPGQQVNLLGRTVSIDLKLDAGSSLDGASLHFYAMKDNDYFYYLQPLVPGDDVWSTASVVIGDGIGPWVPLSLSNPAAVPADVLGDPGEYGFILTPMGSSPSGTLRFDNFVSPEPASVALLALGGVAMLRQRRR